MTYSANQITATIPSAIDPGTVNITVTTPAGTSAVSAARPVHLHGQRHHDRRPPSPAATRPRSRPARPACSTSRRRGRPASARSATPPSAAAPRRRCRPASRSTTPAGRPPRSDGTPQPGDGGTFTVCLIAANGVGRSPPRPSRSPWTRRPSPPPTADSSATRRPVGATARLLAGRLRRRHLHLRLRPVLRFDRFIAPAAPGRRHHADGEPRRLLAGRLGRRHLRLRQCRLLRVHSRQRPQPRRIGPAPQPERAHRRHGALRRRRRLLHGGLGRGRLRLRRRPLRGLLPGHRRLQRRGGGRRARRHRQRLLGRDEYRRRVHLR